MFNSCLLTIAPHIYTDIMSTATIVDRAGNHFVVQLPFEIRAIQEEDQLHTGDVVRVLVDTGMEEDDGPPADVSESIAVVLQCDKEKEKVKLAWMYHTSEMRVRNQGYAYYLTDHVDVVDMHSVDQTIKLPDKLCPYVYSFAKSSAKPHITTLQVETCIACLVTGHWVCNNLIETVFEDGPGHAQHYRDEWEQADAKQQAYAMCMAEKMYSSFPNFDASELAKHVAYFEENF